MKKKIVTQVLAMLSLNLAHCFVCSEERLTYLPSVVPLEPKSTKSCNWHGFKGYFSYKYISKRKNPECLL